MRRVPYWLAGAVLLAIVAGTGIHWLLATNSGAHWILAKVTGATGGDLQLRSVDGDFESGLLVEDLSYRTRGDNAVDIRVKKLRVAAELQWVPFGLRISQATVSGVRIRSETNDEHTTEPGSRLNIGHLLDSLSLPVAIQLDELEINDASMQLGMSGRQYVLNHAVVAGRWHDEIVVNRLQLDAEDMDANATGRIDLDSTHDVTVSGHMTVQPSISHLGTSVSADFNGHGDLDELQVSVDVPKSSLHAQGSLVDLLDNPAWTLVLTASHWPLIDAEQNWQLHNVELQSTGSLSAYTVSAKSTISFSDGFELPATLSGHGNTHELQLTTISTDSNLLRATGSVHLDWRNSFLLTGSLHVAKFDPSQFTSQWPNATPVQGDFDLNLSADRMAISSASFAVDNTDARLRLAATIDWQSGAVDASLQSTNLRWPLPAADTRVTSKQADLQVSGTLDSWLIAGSVDVAAPGFGAGSFQVDGKGDRDQVTVHIPDSVIARGSLQGDVQYRWRGDQPWSIAANIKNVRTELFAQDWPGAVSGKLRIDGTSQPLSLRVELQNIHGTLRGRPLRADGHIEWSKQTLEARNLRIQHGDSQLRLDGNSNGGDGLAFSVAIDDVGKYLAEAGGDLSASGRLMWSSERPLLHLTLSSDDLHYRNLDLHKLRVVDKNTGESVFQAILSADAAVIGGLSVEQLGIDTQMTQSRQQVTVSGLVRAHKFAGGIDGAFSNWQDPLTSTWSGTVNKLQFDLAEDHSVFLQEPASIELSQALVQLGSFCIRDDDSAHLCADGQWRDDGTYNIKADLQNLSIALLEYFVDIPAGFDQTVTGHIEARKDSVAGLSAVSDIEISPGTIRAVGDSDVVVQTGPGRLHFDVAGNSLLSGELQLPFPKLGNANAKFQVLDVQKGRASPVSGRLDLNLDDVKALASFLPWLDESGGSVRADIEISGQLYAPLFAGRIDLRDGSLLYAPIGLQMRDMNLAGVFASDHRLQLQGSFSAGDGQANVTAALNFRRDEPLELTAKIQGKQLQLINMPDLQAAADTDLDIGYADGLLLINGQLLVPKAHIVPTKLTSDRKDASSDVVVVAGTLPGSSEKIKRDNSDKLHIKGEVTLELGKDVEVDLDIAKAKLSGKTSFTWSGEQMPVADGRYDLAGDIEVYGQVLRITDGSIRFPKVSADNPRLRVRAEREIFGNAQIKRAGVLVGGTAQQPTIEAYTLPQTTEERALALLVTGSDFNYEQGVGSVGFGTYIAPRLFVSYGIGLFERENVLSARYDLAKGFGVTVTSGQKQSGVDIGYRFQR